MLTQEIQEVLSHNLLRDRLLHHPFFSDIRTAPLDQDTVSIFLGQWWHPLHYFPDFLSRTISVVPMLEVKTAISRILFQELGEGDPARAHENIYIETMVGAGFARPMITDAAALPATRALVARYEQASSQPLSALGFIYGTEVADLAMVSGIGRAVRRATGHRSLEWVNIHVQQEPDHVNGVNTAIAVQFTAYEAQQIIGHAEEMWCLWIDFFSALWEEIFRTVPEPARAHA